MEKLNALIEKYFRAETTLDEEKQLKEFFRSNNVPTEFIQYKALFSAFDQEQKETMKELVKVPAPKIMFFSRNRFLAITYAAIAAVFLLTLWVVQPNENVDDFAIMNGKKIENAGFAQQYATTKFKNVNTILTKNLQPLSSINKVKSGLKPMKKIGETKEKINDIKKILQIK